MKRFIKRALAGTLTLSMVLGTAVAVNPEISEAKVKVKKVSVSAPSGKKVYVAKGKKVKLTATVKVTPNKKANKKVTYKSANKKVATVSGSGQVKGVKAGKTKITVTSKKNKKKKATITVIVKKAAVKKVKLNASSAILSVGQKKTLKATVTPKSGTSNKVTWSSSKKSVAKVTSKGVVRGVKEGTAKITAKAADGSGKKATCKVTVGTGIGNVTVPTSQIVRVELTSAKAGLNASNFTIQNKETPDGKYNTTEGIEKVETKDGGKTYDVVLDDVSGIASNSYVKVSVPVLKVAKTKEIYVSEIPGYGYSVTDTIQRVVGRQNGTYSSSWYLDDVGQVGTVTYSVTGLPAGLKAYISKNATSVRVVGKFANVENGTTAVLTGVDENGKTYKKSYVFYVGSDSAIVGNVLDQTVLSYIPENKVTNEKASGYSFYNNVFSNYGDDKWGVISGGSGEYEFAATGLPATVSMDSDGYLQIARDADYNRLAVPAGTYPVTVSVKDKQNPALTAAFTFTLNIVEGATLTGTVKDASGAGAKDIEVYGYTKRDAYGRGYSFGVYSGADGKYKARVIAGDYCQYVYYDDAYDLSIGNVYADKAQAAKDFALPLYRVNFAIGIAGAGAYDIEDVLYVYNAQTGESRAISMDRDDKSLYAYLKAGAYEFSPASDDDDNQVTAYTKYNKESTPTESYGYIGEIGTYTLSGSFNVAGNAVVTLAAKLISAPEPEPTYPPEPSYPPVPSFDPDPMYTQEPDGSPMPTETATAMPTPVVPEA